jgi:hypothetical protein
MRTTITYRTQPTLVMHKPSLWERSGSPRFASIIHRCWRIRSPWPLPHGRSAEFVAWISMGQLAYDVALHTY